MINNFKVMFLHTFSSRSMHFPNTDVTKLYAGHRHRLVPTNQQQQLKARCNQSARGKKKRLLATMAARKSVQILMVGQWRNTSLFLQSWLLNRSERTRGYCHSKPSYCSAKGNIFLIITTTKSYSNWNTRLLHKYNRSRRKLFITILDSHRHGRTCSSS